MACPREDRAARQPWEVPVPSYRLAAANWALPCRLTARNRSRGIHVTEAAVGWPEVRRHGP